MNRVFDLSRLRLGIVIAVICGAIAFLLFQVGEAASFYRNVDEAVAQRDELGTKRFQLQGVVVPDSIRRSGETQVAFDVEYNCVRLAVLHSGQAPRTFQEGIPVILGGAFAPGGEEFRSDDIKVRHTEEYRTEESEEAEQTEQERCGETPEETPVTIKVGGTDVNP